MIIDGMDAYRKYVDDRSAGVSCDCDFHRGGWTATTPPKFSNHGGSVVLRYAKHDELLPAGYCNKPKGGQTAWVTKPSTTSAVRMAPVGGMVCKSCNAKNEYAGPNQSDGTYVCYQCRV